MIRRLALLGVFVFGAVAAAADAPAFKDGNWWLGYGRGPINHQPLMIVKAETKDGKTTAEKVAVPAKSSFELDSFKLDGKQVTVAIKIGKRTLTFTGALQADGKSFRGQFGDDKFTDRGVLTATEAEKIDNDFFAAISKAPETYTKAVKIVSAPNAFRFKARQTKDIDEKAELMKKAAEAQEQADADSPAAWRAVIAAEKDSPYAVFAAQQLIQAAPRIKADAKEMAAWVALRMADAASYGPKITDNVVLTTADTLGGEKAYAEIAASVLEKTLSQLTDKDPLARQSQVLKTALKIQETGGKTELAKATAKRYEAVEAAMDKEYLSTMPPFKVTKAEARKPDQTRAAVLELFTGAQCPPCVAADLAFDGLAKAYDHKDVILLQYHMHIPGPDPLTNSDTVARFNYYGDLFPKEVRGTPTALLNGKIQSGAGGGLENAAETFGDFQKAAGTALKDKADIDLTGKVGRVGDKLMIDVSVSGVKEPKGLKLRVVLTEDTIHYVGGNTLRYHHHVVRHFAGGVAGTDLKDAKTAKALTVDLAQVQSELTKYQENYAKVEKITYPNPAPKLDGSQLKVVAFIQDDATGEVLQAVQFDVPAK